MKILCLFVRHGLEKHAGARVTLDHWYASQGLLDHRTLWTIDNALPAGTPPATQLDGSRLLPGDNGAWEFSAWAAALADPAADADHFDVVHLVTSAFNTLYTRYLEDFDADMLPEVVARQLCLGHIDSYDRPVEFAGQASASWIRTCFVFLPLRQARRVQRWAAFTDPAAVFADPATTVFRSDAPLSVDYQLRIRTWLEGQEVGGHTWHSPVGDSSLEIRRFQMKTLAILNEHSLSVRLRSLAIPLADFCWMYTTHRIAGALPHPLPDEATQLKVRRRVLGIPETGG